MFVQFLFIRNSFCIWHPSWLPEEATKLCFPNKSRCLNPSILNHIWILPQISLTWQKRIGHCLGQHWTIFQGLPPGPTLNSYRLSHPGDCNLLSCSWTVWQVDLSSHIPPLSVHSAKQVIEELVLDIHRKNHIPKKIFFEDFYIFLI